MRPLCDSTFLITQPRSSCCPEKMRPPGSEARGPCDPATNNGGSNTRLPAFACNLRPVKQGFPDEAYVKNFWRKVKIAPAFFQKPQPILMNERFIGGLGLIISDFDHLTGPLHHKHKVASYVNNSSLAACPATLSHGGRKRQIMGMEISKMRTADRVLLFLY